MKTRFTMLADAALAAIEFDTYAEPVKSEAHALSFAVCNTVSEPDTYAEPTAKPWVYVALSVASLAGALADGVDIDAPDAHRVDRVRELCALAAAMLDARADNDTSDTSKPRE